MTHSAVCDISATMKILVINPGSTSTKISVFEDREVLFTDSVFHDAPYLLSFGDVNGQTPMRKEVTLELMKQHGFSMSDIDVIVGRGGCAHTQKAGVTIVDKNIYQDTWNEVSGNDHASKLGVLCAYEFSQEFGIPAYTLNPTNIDEYCDEARFTGIKGLYRRTQSHALNQKACVEEAAKKIGKPLEETKFVCAHIDGGITVGAHLGGRMIDCTEGAGGDGPFTPTRLGAIPVLEVARYLEAGHTTADLRKMCSRSGGFVSHFGTSDSKKIHKMIEDGDKHAKAVWDAMCYQTSKAIGEMACVLGNGIDGIILTGGLVRFDDIVSYIEKRCGWIAPFVLFPGELEQEAMAWAVLDVMNGKKKALTYEAKDVFQGFEWDDIVY